MERKIKIDELSNELNITSRTLRHWEDMGLFKSYRDLDSNWRLYDQKLIDRIKLIKTLRDIDIPIIKVKEIIDNLNKDHLVHILKSEIDQIKKDTLFKHLRLETLEDLLVYLNAVDRISYEVIALFLKQHETKKRSKAMQYSQTFKIVQLKETKVVYHTHISNSPEDEAMKPVLAYLKEKNLLGTTKMYGGNVAPLPKGDQNPYGYGFMATIPMDYEVEEPLKTMILKGGLYATIDSTDQIYDSWQTLVQMVKSDEQYQSDRSRLCLEEHLFNENDQGFSLVLYEPIKKINKKS